MVCCLKKAVGEIGGKVGVWDRDLSVGSRFWLPLFVTDFPKRISEAGKCRKMPRFYGIFSALLWSVRVIRNKILWCEKSIEKRHKKRLK